MKEKKLNDLGFDEDEKHLNELLLEYDLGKMGELTDILNKGNYENEE